MPPWLSDAAVALGDPDIRGKTRTAAMATRSVHR